MDCHRACRSYQTESTRPVNLPAMRVALQVAETLHRAGARLDQATVAACEAYTREGGREANARAMRAALIAADERTRTSMVRIVRTALRNRVKAYQAALPVYRYAYTDHLLDQDAVGFLDALATADLMQAFHYRLRQFAADGKYHFSDMDCQQDREALFFLDRLARASKS